MFLCCGGKRDNGIILFRSDLENVDIYMTGLYRQGIEKEEYVIHLMNLLWPTYQVAKNQGFTEWHPGT